MTVRDLGAAPRLSSPARPPSAPAAAAAGPTDVVDIDWSGARPAHRSVKKMVRGAAALVTAAGIGKMAWDIATSPSLEIGLLKASLSLAGTAAAVIGLDLVSGLGHHYGDNYGPKHSFNHTRWHTDPDDTRYCLVGLSNKALDKVGFWPKWEKAIFAATGKKPISWDVAEYQGYATGSVDKEALHQRQVEAGMLQK
jgi:hypothetical protein